ncbi:diaminobutyrate acetyltransferase [Desulfogranum japonicum]|uniref:diaminobutyrate acetyltransferase n=1 Tax=Desulfogranum japonicum TaxID=231447 RepID=UPI0003FA05AA|nr:diaminobutyrate acetyltransferase [Desulfogranum japonicum]
MSTGILYRRPTSQDGPRIHAIAEETGVLSVNSTYAYTLMSRHFPETCIVGEKESEIVAYVIGYTPPSSPETLFVWQIGVARQYQGKGVGKEMLLALVNQCKPRFLESTITRENTASIKVFSSLGPALHTKYHFSAEPFFHKEELGQGEEAEYLMRIGPFTDEPVSAHK